MGHCHEPHYAWRMATFQAQFHSAAALCAYCLPLCGPGTLLTLAISSFAGLGASGVEGCRVRGIVGVGVYRYRITTSWNLETQIRITLAFSARNVTAGSAAQMRKRVASSQARRDISNKKLDALAPEYSTKPRKSPAGQTDGRQDQDLAVGCG